MVAIGLVGFAVVLAIAMIVVKTLTNGSGRKRHATAGGGGAWMSDGGAFADGSDCGGAGSDGGCSDGGGSDGGGGGGGGD